MTTQADRIARIELPAVLDMDAASTVRRNILGEAADAEGLELDAAKVERIGTAGVQVIVAASRMFGGEGRSFSVVRAPQVMQDCFRDLGLEAGF